MVGQKVLVLRVGVRFLTGQPLGDTMKLLWILIIIIIGVLLTFGLTYLISSISGCEPVIRIKIEHSGHIYEK